MHDYSLDYLLLVFASATGVLLVVTAHAGLAGLMVMGRRTSMIVGGALVVGSFGWFFASKPRNVPDTGPGLDGNEQALLFTLGASAALFLLLMVSSARNWSIASGESERGIEALKRVSYLRLLLEELRNRWNSWKVRTKGHSSG